MSTMKVKEYVIREDIPPTHSAGGEKKRQNLRKLTQIPKKYRGKKLNLFYKNRMLDRTMIIIIE